MRLWITVSVERQVRYDGGLAACVVCKSCQCMSDDSRKYHSHNRANHLSNCANDFCVARIIM